MALISRSEYEARLRGVALLITDVDGVLTDGSITYTESETESKTFNVKDGSAVHIAKSIGLPVAVITARSSAAVARRFGELPILRLYQDTFDKVAACRELRAELGLEPGQLAYLGDDLVELPAMRDVGLGIAVADAHARVRAEAEWVLSTAGGRGALREVIDDIVEARDLWDVVLADYRSRADDANGS